MEVRREKDLQTNLVLSSNVLTKDISFQHVLQLGTSSEQQQTPRISHPFIHHRSHQETRQCAAMGSGAAGGSEEQSGQQRAAPLLHAEARVL